MGKIFTYSPEGWRKLGSKMRDLEKGHPAEEGVLP